MDWQNRDSSFGLHATGIHLFETNTPLAGKAQRAFYVQVPLQSWHKQVTTAVGEGKRFTPQAYFDQCHQPLVVVNATFFEFVHNRNLNLVVKDGQMKAFNLHTIAGKGKDTLSYRHPLPSALGIRRNGKADIAWLYTDSNATFPKASQDPWPAAKDSFPYLRPNILPADMRTWKMQTAIGGGPVLVQAGKISVSNNQELKFAGKAIDDAHPRTAMGYTATGDLIILAVEGRHPGKAEGMNLTQLAQALVDLGCVEALNLDGGGSTCLLVNGQETIKPSDASGQRPVPAVLLVQRKK
jgi:hypothetical protein